jgi:DnaJ family protein C protein 8
MIHPDKFKHEHGEDAFNFLSQARDLLCDEKRREEIDSITTYARVVVLREAGLPRTLNNRDPRLTGMNPPFEARLRAQVKTLVLESSADQKKRADMVATNQATQRLATEALASARKRKAEEQITWEQGREARVGSWRHHLDRTKQRKIKKAKKNQYVLG